MHLGLSDDQDTIREVFAAFFTNESPPSVPRAAEPLGFDRSLWQRLLETGAPGMGVPETDGGGGAGLAELVVVAELAGRAIAPVPLVDHQVAARALAAAGHARSDVTDGALIAGLSLRPAIDGRFRLVPAGAVLDVVVGLDGDELVAIESSAPGTGPRNHACMPLADRNTEGTRTVLASGAAAFAAFAHALDEWRTLTAAALIGLAAQALDMGVDYAKTRIQFGKPIGAFQAVQQGLADLPGQIEGGRLLTHKAAWAGDRAIAGIVGRPNPDDNDNTDFATLAAMACIFAGDTASWATDRSLHYHGGYGFSAEYDIQLFYRRARGWALVLDDPSREALRLADTLFGEVA